MWCADLGFVTWQAALLPLAKSKEVYFLVESRNDCFPSSSPSIRLPYGQPFFFLFVFIYTIC